MSLKLDFEMAGGDRLIAEGHGVLVGYDYERGQRHRSRTR